MTANVVPKITKTSANFDLKQIVSIEDLKLADPNLNCSEDMAMAFIISFSMIGAIIKVYRKCQGRPPSN